MNTALGHFRRCLEVYRQAGLMRPQIVNMCMVGHCLDWTGASDAGLEIVREALELSERIGVSQTRVVTLESYALMLLNRGLLAQA